MNKKIDKLEAQIKAIELELSEIKQFAEIVANVELEHFAGRVCFEFPKQAKLEVELKELNEKLDIQIQKWRHSCARVNPWTGEITMPNYKKGSQNV